MNASRKRCVFNADLNAPREFALFTLMLYDAAVSEKSSDISRQCIGLTASLSAIRTDGSVAPRTSNSKCGHIYRHPRL